MSRRKKMTLDIVYLLDQRSGGDFESSYAVLAAAAIILSRMEKHDIEVAVNDFMKSLAEKTKPFNWDDAKPGMAFRDCLGMVSYYIAPDPIPKRKDVVILAIEYDEQKGFDNLCFDRKEELTRVPERDINVA